MALEIDELDGLTKEDGADNTPVGNFAIDVALEKYPSLKTGQDAYLNTNSKYQRYARDEYSTNTEVHEYVGPNGPGFLLFEYETRQDGEYVRCTNKGSESWHEFDWIRVDQLYG